MVNRCIRGTEREYIGDPDLQSLLEEAGVDLYLSGHHHAFYPGVSGGVAFVSQACLGAGPRRLIGTQDRSARGFTLLEFGPQSIQVTAYQGPHFQDANPLPRCRFPARRPGPGCDHQARGEPRPAGYSVMPRDCGPCCREAVETISCQ